MDISFLEADILRQPHTLIAGSTGSGKSVLLNKVIRAALAYGDKYLILIDPKGNELTEYKNRSQCLYYGAPRYKSVLNYHTDMLAGISKAENMMIWRLEDMKKRGLKITDYSDVYLCIDELADLMISSKRKEVLSGLQRLLQLGRAAKIHVIACTQAPNRKIIPAELTINFIAKIGLRTESAIESRQILNMSGAERLPIYGYCYYKRPGKVDLHKITMED